MAHDFWVTIHGVRGEESKRATGTASFPIKTPMAVAATVRGEEKQVYLLELQALDVATREKMVAHLAQKFGMAQAEVQQLVAESGIPIAAEDCSITVFHPQRWFL